MLNKIKQMVVKAQDAIILFVIGIILLIGVSIPITQQTIATANLTGLTATVVSFIPVFIGVAGLVLAANLTRLR